MYIHTCVLHANGLLFLFCWSTVCSVLLRYNLSFTNELMKNKKVLYPHNKYDSMLWYNSVSIQCNQTFKIFTFSCKISECLCTYNGAIVFISAHSPDKVIKLGTIQYMLMLYDHHTITLFSRHTYKRYLHRLRQNNKWTYTKNPTQTAYEIDFFNFHHMI